MPSTVSVSSNVGQWPTTLDERNLASLLAALTTEEARKTAPNRSGQLAASLSTWYNQVRSSADYAVRINDHTHFVERAYWKAIDKLHTDWVQYSIGVNPKSVYSRSP